MKYLSSLALATVIGLTGFTTLAQTSMTELSFEDPWIRGSVPGQKNGAGYLVIENQGGQPAALVSVDSDRADRVELHTIVREDGVAKMREVTEIPVPANGSVTLKPGGYHIMLIGLTEPFNAGQSVPMTLNFESGQSTTVTFEVKPPTYMGAGNGHGHGGHDMKKSGH